MKKHLLLLLGLTLLSACHVGTYKKEICNNKNVVEILNVEGEYNRTYKNSKKMMEIIKGDNGKGSYALRENRPNKAHSDKAVMVCKVGDKIIAEFRDYGQRVWFGTDTLTFAFIEIQDNELILKGINRKDMGIPTVNNTSITAEETINQFIPKDEYYTITFKAAEATTRANSKRPKILISE